MHEVTLTQFIHLNLTGELCYILLCTFEMVRLLLHGIIQTLIYEIRNKRNDIDSDFGCISH